MITLHPAFDPKTKTWFIEGYKKEAKTLAALQAIFHEAHLEGYYPQGYVAQRPKGPSERIYLPVKGSFHMQPAERHKPPTPIKPTPPKKPIHRVETKPRPPSQKKYDHSAILDLWAKGLSGPEIGAKLNLHSSTTAAQIVGNYYDKDPRAIRRAPARTREHVQPNPLTSQAPGRNS